MSRQVAVSAEDEVKRLTDLTKEYSLYQQTVLRQLPAVLRQAIGYKLIKPGYTFAHYMNEQWSGNPEIMQKFGIQNQGFGSALYWAPQGSFKSNLTLLHGYQVYGNWSEVLKRNIMTLEDLIDLYAETREARSYIPWVNIDDVSMIFSKQLWFEKGGSVDQAGGNTGRDLYIQLEKILAGIRRRVSWLSFSTPYPENLLKILQKNLSYEIWLYPRPAYIVNKYIRMIDPYHEGRSILRKIVIEHRDFDPRYVNEVWSEYSAKREKVDDMVFRPLEEIVKQKNTKVPKMHVTKDKFVQMAQNCGIRADGNKIYQLWRQVSDEPDEGDPEIR